jgi:histidinol-phosphate aminotransferase
MDNRFIREHIRSMKPYEPIIPIDVLSEQLNIPVDALVKLDANENPYGMPPASIRRLQTLSYGHIYPDPESRHFRQKLSEHLQVPLANIVVGAGADELIDLLIRLTMNPGDGMINCPPTFGFYDAAAQVHDLRIKKVYRNRDFSLDYAEIANAANAGAKLIFLANPNNPDGGLIDQETLSKILELPIIVVMDEAYIEFAKPHKSLVSEVLNRDNLVVLRTFSKWGGLAGMRLGYGILPSAIASEIMKIKQPYNVSVAASEAGLGALEDVSTLNERLDRIITERTRLIHGLEKLGYLQPYPTYSNFVLCKVLHVDAYQLKSDLMKQGILVRYFRTAGLEDHLRFSIGKAQDTDRLLAALEELVP